MQKRILVSGTQIIHTIFDVNTISAGIRICHNNIKYMCSDENDEQLSVHIIYHHDVMPT